MRSLHTLTFMAMALTAGFAAAQSAYDSPSSTATESTATEKTTASDRTTSASASTESPQAVLSAIHTDNQLEIQAGQLAQQKGASEQVRQLGKQLSDDHNSADNKVEALAKKKGLDLSKESPDREATRHAAEENKEIAKLQSLSGAAFDKAFLSAMAKGHKETIEQLDKAKTSVQDKDVQQLIDDLMPTLHKHESAAAQGAETSSSSSSSSDSSKLH